MALLAWCLVLTVNVFMRTAQTTGSSRTTSLPSRLLETNGQTWNASRIYAYDSMHLSRPTPISTFTNSQVRCETFYVRVSVSPNSRYVACGSADGGIYAWDTEGPGDDGVRLVGHEKETSGLDWGRDSVRSSLPPSSS